MCRGRVDRSGSQVVNRNIEDSFSTRQIAATIVLHFIMKKYIYIKTKTPKVKLKGHCSGTDSV